MLFLLRDEHGKALMIAHAASKNEADAFGRANLPNFCGESLELTSESRPQAEEFWGVLTVEVPSAAAMQTGTTAVKTKKKKVLSRRPEFVTTHVWVRGLELPEDVIEDDVLTAEDRRDLALDHIARTSDYIGRVEIRKWARG